MKKEHIILIIFLAGAVGLVGFFRSTNLTSLPPVVEVISLEPQTSEEGPVSVLVTPKSLSNDRWIFDVAFDTHSVELDFDPVETAVLMGAGGEEYTPLKWEGDPPGGHPRSGILVFASIMPAPKGLRLVMRDVGGVANREFSWAVDL